MDDGSHLLRAILENPADDLLRLVYADWLDEFEPPEWDLCRACCGTGNLDCDNWPKRTCEACNGVPKKPAYSRGQFIRDSIASGTQVDNLGLSIIRSERRSWFGPLPDYCYRPHFPTTQATIFVRRGFTFCFSCDPTCFEPQWMAPVFASQPIENVSFPGKKPRPVGSQSFQWLLDPVVSNYSSPPPFALPPTVFYRLPQKIYRSSNNAMAALSRICLTLGREWANLPPLKKVKVK